MLPPELLPSIGSQIAQGQREMVLVGSWVSISGRRDRRYTEENVAKLWWAGR